MQIVLSGVRPYDGTYPFDFDGELTTREFGWIKRLSGYLPLQLEDALAGVDPEFFCVLAAIALVRAGRITARDVPQVFERLQDAPFGSAITVDTTDDELEDEDDAGSDADPPESFNGSLSSSGPDSRTSSETSGMIRTVSGMPVSVSSASDPQTSGR